jgi:GT2 family glycosyltransferase
VEILIPTRDRVDLLAACVDSLQQTDYPNWSIAIIDNDSNDSATHAFFAERGIRVIPAPGPFNYAAIMNIGVAASTADYVVALNNDVTIADPNWLRHLIDVALDQSVGVVGVSIVDHDGHSDHEGIAIAPYPVHITAPVARLSGPAATRPVSAVTGAVQLVRRSIWNEVGGMDESLAVTCNDVDFCLRTQERGYATVVVPHVTVTHRASSSRGRLDPTADRARFCQRWGVLRDFFDPYFPPSFALLGPHLVERRDVPPLG